MALQPLANRISSFGFWLRLRRVVFLSVFVCLLLLPGALLCQEKPSDAQWDCFKCHEKLAEAIAKDKVQHKPVQESNCSTCHDRRASAHGGLLDKSGEKLCVPCHASPSPADSVSFSHEPFRKGDCVKCHASHSSAWPRLLREGPDALCLRCHSPETLGMNKPAVHRPVLSKRCLSCHMPHHSSVEHLLRKPAAELCKSCHNDASLLREQHGGNSVLNADCACCHVAHASDKNGLLRNCVHQPVAEAACDKCHKDTAKAELKKSGAELCFDCHDRSKFAAIKTHQPVAEGQCARCHAPHASANQRLLTQPVPVLCDSCHPRKPDGARSVHAPYAKGECGKCHSSHSSDRPALTTEGPGLDLCLRCHQRHDHPVDVVPSAKIKLRPDSAVKLDENGKVTCASCHASHEAKNPLLLRYPADRELCVQCHEGF